MRAVLVLDRTSTGRRSICHQVTHSACWPISQSTGWLGHRQFLFSITWSLLNCLQSGKPPILSRANNLENDLTDPWSDAQGYDHRYSSATSLECRHAQKRKLYIGHR